MVNCIIVGSMGLDRIETPFGKVMDEPGGSAFYASVAARFFTKPGVVSIVGKDFPRQHQQFLEAKQIDLDGLKVEGRTFRWDGLYEYDMNDAKTLNVELNSLASFRPVLSERYKDAEFVFLANTHPQTQIDVMEQLRKPKAIVLDTMNYWIDNEREALMKAIGMCDVFVLNEGEARMLFDNPNLVVCGRQGLKLGPKAVIIKKGEHGALLFKDEHIFASSGYPLELVKDPTGCGDSFAGTLTGFLASQDSMSLENLKKAVVYGSVIASFNAEDFGANNLRKIKKLDIEERMEFFRRLTEF
ncbi:sugar kinase [Candidatus Woesearchaeota archaeon]|nr:sugar kinase [Candidatus Woesearchaeota archaeon]